LPDEVTQQILAEIEEPGRLADLVAGYIDIPAAERQLLLETLSVEGPSPAHACSRSEQIGVLSPRRTSSPSPGRARRPPAENFLREQLKTIQKELGEGDEGKNAEDLKE